MARPCLGGVLAQVLILSSSALLCSIVTGLTTVYDETAWSKVAWAQFQLPPLDSNPSDENPSLLRYLPHHTGLVPRNSLDGPFPRRLRASKRGLFDDLPETWDDAHLLQPAALAVQCTVCHALLTRAWQLLVLDVLVGEQPVTRDAVKATLQDACDTHVTQAVLSRSTIYKVSGDTGQQKLVFFVVRERKKGSMASSAERSAVAHACKTLVQEMGGELEQALTVGLSQYRDQLQQLLQKHGLRTVPADAVPDDALVTPSSDSDAGSAAASSMDADAVAAAVLESASKALSQLAGHQQDLAGLAHFIGQAARAGAEAGAQLGQQRLRALEEAAGAAAGGAAGGQAAGIAAGAGQPVVTALGQAGGKPSKEGEDQEEPAAAGKPGDAAGAAPAIPSVLDSHLRALLAELAGSVGFEVQRDGPGSGAAAGASPGSGDDDDDEYEDGEDEEGDGCMDKHPRCKLWARQGECEANPNYMVGGSGHEGHCLRSCGLCPPSSKKPAIKPEHAALAADIQATSKALLQALKNNGCGASKACLTGVSGTSHTPAVVSIQQPAAGSSSLPPWVQQEGSGWSLGKPTFGVAQVRSLPPEVLAELHKQQAAAGSAAVGVGKEQAQAVQAVLAAELADKALLLPAEFFTYEFVYRNHTRHFHKEGKKYTEDWLMGRFQRESIRLTTTTGAQAMLDAKDLLPDQRGTMEQQDWPYMKQVYGQGDVCVLAGNKRVIRRTEVRIACSPDEQLHMLIREPDFCTYIWVIYSPGMCQIPSFAPRSRGSGGT